MSPQSEYVSFSEEEILAAANTDLKGLLSMRGYRFKQSGKEDRLIYTDGAGEHDSICIYGWKWFDHKNQVGGNAIQFMKHFFNMHFANAVQELLVGQAVGVRQAVRSKPRKPKEFKLPKRSESHRRAFAYLAKTRGIDADVISAFMH